MVNGQHLQVSNLKMTMSQLILLPQVKFETNHDCRDTPSIYYKNFKNT
jgi:hypothetical protein